MNENFAVQLMAGFIGAVIVVIFLWLQSKWKKHRQIQRWHKYLLAIDKRDDLGNPMLRPEGWDTEAARVAFRNFLSRESRDD